MKYLGKITDNKDLVTKEYTDAKVATTTSVLKGDGNGNAVAAETQAATMLDIDTTVTASSSNLITSGAVATAIAAVPVISNLHDGTNTAALYQTSNTVSNDNAAAFGSGTTASGVGAFAEGYLTTASGTASHAEGYFTQSIGIRSHAEGGGESTNGAVKAEGSYSHAEGHSSTTSSTAEAAHAEGFKSTATNKYAHAEGNTATASGESSHAEGISTTASGTAAHAEGSNTTASGFYSHASGYNTIANGSYQTVIGRFNDETVGGYFIVGNGTSASAKSNALVVATNGDLIAGRKITAGMDPANNLDVATKQYVDARSVPTVKTALDTTLEPNTCYDLGSSAQSTLTLALPSSGMTACQEIYVAFKSGATATTLTITGTYVGDTAYAPSSNCIAELSFKYICGTWVLVTKETSVSA